MKYREMLHQQGSNSLRMFGRHLYRPTALITELCHRIFGTEIQHIHCKLAPIDVLREQIYVQVHVGIHLLPILQVPLCKDFPGADVLHIVVPVLHSGQECTAKRSLQDSRTQVRDRPMLL